MLGENQNHNDRSPVSRERLYEEVWTQPATALANKYGVSGSFLARVCTKLDVPRPPRGYWARIAAGYPVGKRPSLPNPKPGAELEWARYGEAKRAPLKFEERKFERKRRNRSELPALHPLLDGFQERINEGSTSYFNPYIRPIKRLLADIVTSPKMGSRIIEVANELYLGLETHGHQVKFAPHGQPLWRQGIDEREKVRGGHHDSHLWYPSRPTLVFIGHVAIGLTIYEMTEYVEVRTIDGKPFKITDLTPQQLKRAARTYSWTGTQDMLSGRLCIQAYSPYSGVAWMRQWQEKKAGDFPGKVPAIIKELESALPSIAKLVEEAARKAEIERQEWERQREIERQQRKIEEERRAKEEAERRRIKADKDSRDELSGIIDAWAKAKRIEEFFGDAERQAAQLGDDDKAIVTERLKLAREMIGSTDALKWFRSWRTPDEQEPE